MPAEPTPSLPRLLVVARPFDLSDHPFDGFVARRLSIMALLESHFGLHILLLRPPGDTAAVHPRLAPKVVGELEIAGQAATRGARMRRLLQSPALRAAQIAHGEPVGQVLRRERPAAAITFGPWLEQEFGPVFSAVPTVHFYEEELARMPEIAPQSPQARLLRRLEAHVDARREPTPAATVVIAPNEVAPARRRFRTPMLWYPYLLDPEAFPLASTPSAGEEVLVVGQFAEPRNAEGLVDVLSALARHPDSPRVSLISQAGVHDLLTPALGSGQLTNLGFVPDLYGAYRRAVMTLVPARRATGIKTTVLQAWAAGTPVVCFEPIAAAFGGRADHAVLAGRSPEEVGAAIRSLVGREDLRRSLATCGCEALVRDFDPDTQNRRLLELITRISGGAGDRGDRRLNGRRGAAGFGRPSG